MAQLAGFEFMAAPERTHHFDDHFVRQQVLPKMFLSPHLPVRVSKVRREGDTFEFVYKINRKSILILILIPFVHRCAETAGARAPRAAAPSPPRLQRG